LKPMLCFSILKMSDSVQSSLYLQLSEKQKTRIIYENSITNPVGYTLIIHTLREIENFEDKYMVIYDNTYGIDIDGGSYFEGIWSFGYIAYFYKEEDPETIIQCLESMNIDQLLNDGVLAVRVWHSRDISEYEETVFEYDYDNEKWLKEPLMYDDDDDCWIKGEIN